MMQTKHLNASMHRNKKMGETNGQMWARMGIQMGKSKHDPKRRSMRQQRDYPGELLFNMQALGWPIPVREHKFHNIRNWRLDLAWPDIKLAVECHGGVYSNGRHVRGKGFTNDREKMNAAMLQGWTVLEVACPHQMGEALTWIEQSLQEKGAL